LTWWAARPAGACGRIDYLLRVEVERDTQPVAMALIEAKAKHLPPDHGLEQARAYADARRLNVSFVYATHGHLCLEFDRFTKGISAPQPLSAFPSPADLRARYEVRIEARGILRHSRTRPPQQYAAESRLCVPLTLLH
jgi:type I restriction enzyme R subunit